MPSVKKKKRKVVSTSVSLQMDKNETAQRSNFLRKAEVRQMFISGAVELATSQPTYKTWGWGLLLMGLVCPVQFGSFLLFGFVVFVLTHGVLW